VEWRPGEVGSVAFFPSIFCLSGSGKNLQEENQFTKPKTSYFPQKNTFFLSAQCISTVGIQNPASARIRTKNNESCTF
jgi:hypothetical protein